MSTTQRSVENQMSVEKKTYLFKTVSFAFLQISILSFGVMLGLWIVAIMRWAEVKTNSQVKLFLDFAIFFTVFLFISIAVTAVTYWLYLKNRNELDGYIDQSVKKISDDKKQNININVVSPSQKPGVAPAPIGRPAAPSPVRLVKKVTTTTTTNTTPVVQPRPAMPTPMAARPNVAPVGRPVVPPRPGMPTPMAARPGMPSPMANRPGIPPRPGIPSTPVRK